MLKTNEKDRLYDLITAMIGAAVFWAAGMRWWKFALMAGAAAIAAPVR